MYDSGSRDLQEIEQALLAEDPRFFSRFRQAIGQLDDAAMVRPPGPVVVGVDDTLTSMRAVRWAAQQASGSGAEISVVHSFRQRSFPLDIGMEGLEDVSCREVADEICRSAVDLAAAVAPNCRCTGALVSGPEAPGLLRAAGQDGLLVVSGASPTVIGTLLHIAMLRHLLTRGRCSLAVLPRDATADGAVDPAGRVSVVLDGGPGDAAAMAWGLWLADAQGCGLAVACPPGLASIAAATATLRTVRGQLPAPDVTWTTGSSSAAIVMGQLKWSPVAVVVDRSAVPVGGLLRGRTGRQLLRQARCPVVLTCTADVAGRSR